MHRYWWVNHKQTVREEIGGQYLWSPKTERNGANSQSYSNMRRASPGDFVLSYANQEIAHVGRVADFAFTAPKPKEFGSVGEYWADDGWLLPVFWTPLSPAVRPKAILETLAPHLPLRISPIQAATGNGNQKIYLAEISKPAFEAVLTSATYDHLSLARGGSNSLTFEVVSEIIDDAIENQIERNLTLDETMKRSLISARRGQGKFRSNLERIEKGCRLTGVTNSTLLIASHIKPWRACERADERMDGNNGLLLTPDADLLFDRGFITFGDDGEVSVSSRIDLDDMRRLGFSHLVQDHFGFAESAGPGFESSFIPRQCEYMAYHRKEVFLS